MTQNGPFKQLKFSNFLGGEPPDPPPPQAALGWRTGERLVSYSVRFVSYMRYLRSTLVTMALMRNHIEHHMREFPLRVYWVLTDRRMLPNSLSSCYMVDNKQ